MPRSTASAGRSAAIMWPRPGVTTMANVNVPAAGDGQVTVEVSVSVVSPGTERARFLGLENATVRFPHRPGYLAAGHVAADPESRLTGATVAARGAPHQRLVTVARRDVHAVPAGVDLGAAATWPLAITALHGLDAAGEEHGSSLAVVGSGLLGVLVRRLAVAHGATHVVAVAASDAKRWTVEAEGTTVFLVAADGADPDELDVDVVMDTTGTAEGLLLAASLAPSGAPVVLLGSPRCARAPFPAAAVWQKGLRLVGAHGDAMRLVSERTGTDPEPRLTDEFFEHLATRRLVLDDVLHDHVPATEAARFYRRLASDRHVVGVTFDWEPGPAPTTGAPIPKSVARTEHAPVRFGLFGCGDIGLQNAAAVAGASGAELVARFDPVEHLAEEVKTMCGAAVMPSPEALLERDDVDIVFVATPHDLHEPLVLAALAAGKHVLVEKPLAANLAAAVRIAAAADGAETHVGICLPMRDDPRVVAAREAVSNGLVGTPHGALGTYLADKPPSYYFGGFSSRAPSTWRLSNERSGGGVLIMNLVHHLDMVRHVTGREAIEVRAATLALNPDGGIEDLASVVIDFGGLIATFVAGSHVVRGPGDSLRIWGDAGQVEILPALAVRSLLPHTEAPPTPRAEPGPGHIERIGARILAARPPSPVARVTRRIVRARRSASAPRPDEENERRVRFVERFASAIANGTSPEPSVEDGLAVQAIVAAAYRAAADGTSVRPADLLREAGR